MAKSGASKGAKNIKPFDEQDTKLAQGKMPDYIFESIQRQYGNKKYGEYTIEDKKNVINWHKKKV
jgi:hypothetical protein